MAACHPGYRVSRKDMLPGWAPGRVMPDNAERPATVVVAGRSGLEGWDRQMMGEKASVPGTSATPDMPWVLA
jgi:hypothetical protein